MDSHVDLLRQNSARQSDTEAEKRLKTQKQKSSGDLRTESRPILRPLKNRPPTISQFLKDIFEDKSKSHYFAGTSPTLHVLV